MQPAGSSARRLLLALAAVRAAAAAVPRTNLTDPAARCMDGTLSAFYHRPGIGANASKFIIYLEGGGECVANATCHAALTSVLGSSDYFPPAMGDLPFFLSDNAGSNKDFASWTAVYVPYCSQDLHSGRVTQPSPSTFGLYFSGHLIFKAVLDALEATAGLGSATDIVLTGASAGGIGVWVNVDFLAQRVPAARTVAVPIAGFYAYAFPYTGPNHTASGLANFQPGAWPGTYALWDAFVDESCAAGNPAAPWVCMLSNNSYPWISAPSFVVEAQTDQVQLEAHDWVPAAWIAQPPEQAYLSAWKQNMSAALAPLLDPRVADRGAFFPACFIHTSFSFEAPLINGTSYVTALARWLFQTSPPSEYKLQDTCGLTCNPTCPK